MRQMKCALACLAALAILAGCGGSGPGDQTLKTRFSAQVTFGDSLSDVGTYAVGSVAALHGGRFSINGDNTAINAALTGKNWTELMAAQFGLPAPCPAETGLNGDPLLGFSVAPVAHPGCLGYAQGGARVTELIGPGHDFPLGALTVPVVTQIQNHLALSGGKFSGTEIVFVMAGGNDALFQLSSLSAAATSAGQTAFAGSLVGALAAGATNPATAALAIGAALAAESARAGHTDTSVVTAAVGAAAGQPGNAAVAASAVYGPMVVAAQAAGTAAGTAYASAHGADAVQAMASAGAELVALVKNQVLANGANYVAVVNLPDLATTPAGRAKDAATQGLIAAMVKAFNDQLDSGLAGVPKVALVDAYFVSHDEATNPAPYGLSNVTQPACNLTAPSNPLGSALACNAGNLNPGDVSHYAFADDVHPTPFNNWLLARFVSEKLVAKGWM